MATQSSPTTTSRLHPDRISSGYLTYCIVSGIFMLIAAICVVFRFIQRYKIRDFRGDDWTILGSFVFGMGVFITNILISLPSLGAAGYHINEYSLSQLHVWAKLGLAAETLYNPSIALSKISALLFYRRIFSADGQFLIFMRIMIFLIVAQFLSSVIGLIFSYNPIEAQWIVEMPHTTINTKAFYITTAVINILLDIAILGIAQVKVWQLHLDTKRKVLLSLVFLLGALTVIASILRIVYLETVDSADSTYTLTTAGIWTNVEMFLLIICSCLPILYSLLRLQFNRGHQANPNINARKTKKNGGSLLTFGSAPARPKKSMLSNDIELSGSTAGYHVICETGCHGEMDGMAYGGPVQVQAEYSVYRSA